jgi:hypothetical protein
VVGKLCTLAEYMLHPAGCRFRMTLLVEMPEPMLSSVLPARHVINACANGTHMPIQACGWYPMMSILCVSGAPQGSADGSHVRHYY